MPAIVYRITEVLSAIVIDLPLGTNLGLFHILWTLLSGRLLQSRGALIPALAATGLEPATVRRAWAAFAHGAWDISQLIAALRAVVRQEGRWHAQHIGGYRVVAVDTTGFFRPRLKNCATKHYLSQAGEALPAIPFGLIASVGASERQTVPLVRQIVRAPSATATEAELVSAVLAQTATQLAPDEAAVVDRGFTTGKTARRPKCRAGSAACRGTLPPDASRYRSMVAKDVAPAAAPWSAHWPARAKDRPWWPPHPIAPKPFSFAGRSIQVDIWSGLCLPQAEAAPPSFQCIVVRDPAYAEPWVLATNLTLPAADLLAVLSGTLAH